MRSASTLVVLSDLTVRWDRVRILSINGALPINAPHGNTPHRGQLNTTIPYPPVQARMDVCARQNQDFWVLWILASWEGIASRLQKNNMRGTCMLSCNVKGVCGNEYPWIPNAWEKSHDWLLYGQPTLACVLHCSSSSTQKAKPRCRRLANRRTARSLHD